MDNRRCGSGQGYELWCRLQNIQRQQGDQPAQRELFNQRMTPCSSYGYAIVGKHRHHSPGDDGNQEQHQIEPYLQAGVHWPCHRATTRQLKH